MKSVFIYGSLMGILCILNDLNISPILGRFVSIRPDLWVRFVIITGCMLFAINHFLKYNKSAKKYNYVMGIGLGLWCSIIGAVIFSVYSVVTFPPNKTFSLIDLFLPSFLDMTREGIIYSLFIPVFFLSRKEKINTKRTDILDDDLE